MTDPPRLFDATNDAFERRLLRSARQDCGTASAQARCAAIVSAATIAVSKVGFAATASSVAATSSAATASSATTVAASAASVGVAALGKAVAVGLTLGLAAQGAYVVGHRALSREVTSTTRSAPTHSSIVNGERAASAPVPSAVIYVIPSAIPIAQSAPVAPSRAASASASASASATATTVATPRVVPFTAQPATSISEHAFDDSLEREVALLDQARQACRIGEYSHCLYVLDQHDRQFPSGMLGPEAVVIRAQALLGLGRRGDAETIAKRFMAFHPKSAAAKRLEVLLGAKSK